MSGTGGLVTTAEPVADDVRTPAQRAMDDRDWSFDGAWPYAPRWLHADGVRVHYVDEGPRDASPVVMLHGSPTWAFVFRHVIARVRDAGLRAIAPDQLGFGRSDKPHRLREYSLARQSLLFEALLDELELDDVTLVAHEWGGPVALAWAARNPERVRALVLSNSFLTPPRRGGRGPAQRLLVKGVHRSVHRAVWADPSSERLGNRERDAYGAPHPSWDSRTGILALERALSGSQAALTHAHVDGLRRLLPALATTPSAIVWGMRDASVPHAALEELRRALPGARVEELDEIGHLVPEFSPDALAGAALALARDAAA